MRLCLKREKVIQDTRSIACVARTVVPPTEKDSKKGMNVALAILMGLA